MDFEVPAEFAEAEWAKDVDSVDKLWAKTANSQELIGRKGILVPPEYASDEDKTKFKQDVLRNHFGAGASVEDYKFKAALEGVKRDDEFSSVMKQKFFDHQVPVEAMQDIVETVETYKLEDKLAAGKQTTEAQAAAAKAFEAASTELWGDRKEDALAVAAQLMAEDLPEAMKAEVAEMDEKSLLYLSVVADTLAKKYTGESKFLSDKSFNQVHGDTLPPNATYDQLSKAQRALMSNPDFRNAKSPNYAALQEQNKKIREKMMVLVK